jgi:hypothetical protein
LNSEQNFWLIGVYLKIVLSNDDVDYTMQWTIKKIARNLTAFLCSSTAVKKIFPKLVALFELLSLQN